jgi:hypothetical protein
MKAAEQGDQIGRFFFQWAIVCYEQFLKISKSGLNVCGYFCARESCVMIRATFWADFSQTHPVALQPNYFVEGCY